MSLCLELAPCCMAQGIEHGDAGSTTIFVSAYQHQGVYSTLTRNELVVAEHTSFLLRYSIPVRSVATLFERTVMGAKQQNRRPAHCFVDRGGHAGDLWPLVRTGVIAIFHTNELAPSHVRARRELSLQLNRLPGRATA